MNSSNASKLTEPAEPLPVHPTSAPPGVRAEGSASRDATDSTADTFTCLFNSSEPTREFRLEDLPSLARDSHNLAWVDLFGYSEASLKSVADLLSLHPVSVQAALAPWQRPRLDEFADYVYMSASIASVDSAARIITVGELGIYVGHNFLVTTHRQDVRFLQNVKVRLSNSPELAQLHTAFALYIVLDELVTYYEGLFEQLEDEIEGAEQRALTDPSDDFLAELVQLKRYVFGLGRLVDQHRQVFAALTRPDFTLIAGSEAEPYFKDVQQRLAHLTDRLLTAREAANGAFDIYVSHVAHRTNQLIKLLTVISTVLLPATLIVALSQATFQLQLLNSRLGLSIMLLGVVLVPSAILAVIWRRGLI
ncbi:MAG: magnesium transporter CorA family protein [Candidatus Dormibacteraeota bacterium]|nr:magnesium transporter CorA family protein [Candidatus Dormibacteraeota bacterium]